FKFRSVWRERWWTCVDCSPERQVHLPLIARLEPHTPIQSPGRLVALIHGQDHLWYRGVSGLAQRLEHQLTTKTALSSFWYYAGVHQVPGPCVIHFNRQQHADRHALGRGQPPAIWIEEPLRLVSGEDLLHAAHIVQLGTVEGSLVGVQQRPLEQW